MSYESHKYYNGNLYASNAKDLHAGIAMDVEKPTIITKLICGYCNGCKKISNYYETYMQVL